MADDTVDTAEKIGYLSTVDSANKAVSAVLTPEEQGLLQQMREDRKKNPDAALENVRKAEVPPIPHLGKVHAEIQAAFGYDPENPGSRNLAEDQRLKQADLIMEAIYRLSDPKEGFAAMLTKNPELINQAELNKMIMQIIEKGPYGDQIMKTLGGMDTAKARAFIEGLLTNDDLRTLLINKLDGLREEGQAIKEPSQSLERRVARAKSQVVTEQDHLDKLNEEFEKARAEHRRLSDPGDARSRGKEYHDLTPRIQSMRDNQQTQTATAAFHEARRRELVEERREGRRDVGEINREMGEHERLRNEADAEAKRLGGIITSYELHAARIEDWRKRADEFQKQVREQTKVLTEAEKEYGDAEKEYSTAHSAVEKARAKLAKGIQEALPQTLKDYIVSEYGKNKALAEATLEKKKNESTEGMEKHIREVMESYDIYSDGGKKHRFNKTEINEHYRLLMEDGPEALIRTILNEGIKQNKYSAEDVDKMLKDPKFIEKIQPDLLKTLMMKRMESGGRFTGGEAYRITHSKWGVGLIDQAVAANKSAKATVDKLREDGRIKGSLGEFLAKNPKGVSIAAILLAILSGIAFTPIAGALVGAAVAVPGLYAAAGATTEIGAGGLGLGALGVGGAAAYGHVRSRKAA